MAKVPPVHYASGQGAAKGWRLASFVGNSLLFHIDQQIGNSRMVAAMQLVLYLYDQPCLLLAQSIFVPCALTAGLERCVALSFFRPRPLTSEERQLAWQETQQVTPPPEIQGALQIPDLLARTAANFFDATSEQVQSFHESSGYARMNLRVLVTSLLQAHPIALWILGPSSVGKSTITV